MSPRYWTACQSCVLILIGGSDDARSRVVAALDGARRLPEGSWGVSSEYTPHVLSAQPLAPLDEAGVARTDMQYPPVCHEELYMVLSKRWRLKNAAAAATGREALRASMTESSGSVRATPLVVYSVGSAAGATSITTIRAQAAALGANVRVAWVDESKDAPFDAAALRALGVTDPPALTVRVRTKGDDETGDDAPTEVTLGSAKTKEVNEILEFLCVFR